MHMPGPSPYSVGRMGANIGSVQSCGDCTGDPSAPAQGGIGFLVQAEPCGCVPLLVRTAENAVRLVRLLPYWM